MAKIRQKSKKDVAFEQERAKFRHQIRDLEREIKEQKIKMFQLEEVANLKDKEIDELKEWISRLLEYMDLSEEDMKRMIKAEKTRADFILDLAAMSNVFSKYLKI